MRTAGILAATLILTACVGEPGKPGEPGSPSASGRTVAARSDAGVTILDPVSGRAVVDLPLAVAAPDGSMLYAAKTEGDRTTVSAIDPRGGSSRATRAIEGLWAVPTIGTAAVPAGVSRDGSRLVLVEAAPTGGRSRFAVVGTDLAAARAPRLIELSGTFTYDALSPDGAILYVIEHPDPSAPSHYVVRAVDVGPGTLRDAVVVDKRNIDEKMAGTPITQAEASNGWTYTLYAGAEHLFVHGLDTTNAAAVCIDLPHPKNPSELDAAAWSMAMRPDGRRLLVASSSLGRVHEIDAVDFKVARSASIEALGTGRTSLALDAGARRLFVGGRDGVAIVDVASLEVVGRALEGSPVLDLAATADGKEILALDANRTLHRLDASDGTVLGSVGTEGARGLVGGTASPAAP